MRILLTGGTGFIGSAVARDLLGAGHEVLALARSKSSADNVAAIGCHAVRGGLADAADWLPAPDRVDAVIHTAATFGPDMADVEAAFLGALAGWAEGWSGTRGTALPLVYTGGCWLYGAVGDRTAVEGAPFDPLPAFAYMVDGRRRLIADPRLSTRIVHPAMVWDDGAGVIGGFCEDAGKGDPPVVIGGLDTRWPLVHRRDLARVYRLALERGDGGMDYHGVSESGVRVGDIARAVALRFGTPAPVVRPVGDAVAEMGAWAAGYALDQTMEAPRTRAALGWAPAEPGGLEAIGRG